MKQQQQQCSYVIIMSCKFKKDRGLSGISLACQREGDSGFPW